ncbi:hypothetical protein TVAG_412700 [Trichomonas vaginalis G3]|uniref:Saposin B-type domain-containing protein n=1 Tax=Trichomonas vaginalis (strain ATCC PRA-98 / G3) TaxID=412133 RepID=A2EV83_TRIV3|nr:saposin family [Trichomonas vaginalis G3]EAY03466.1 hypothetical protein TVAG_412700 [Trichomonas vaginalis G3]KAI5486200.1 saposin family [Trichomonas vaginalis G3]|eukprot:XP_001315689.1 hypothetical protein [Trichomonas vaginalis G3]
MFFLILSLVGAHAICDWCKHYGEGSLSLARSGASRETIKQMALSKCDSLPDSIRSFSKLCKMYVNKKLDSLIQDAREHPNCDALCYCQKKHYC